MNFQGCEPCPKKPGHHLRISVHIREEQSFVFFFLSPALAATVVFVVICAGRAASGKGKARV